MKLLQKIALFSVVGGAACLSLYGCGSSGPEASSDFENAIRSPKGPPPPEAAKAAQEQLANDRNTTSAR